MASGLIHISDGQPPVPIEKWDFWQKQSGSPFQASCFFDALKRLGWEPNYFAHLNSQGELVGTITAVSRKKWGLSWTNFFSEPTASPDISLALLAPALNHLRARSSALLQSSGSMGRWSPAQIDALQAAVGTLRTEPFGTYALDLRRSEEELWKGLHSKHRNVVRTAERAGIEIQERGTDFTKEELERVYELLQVTLSRGRTPVPHRDFFIGISENWLRNGFAKLYLAYDKNRIIAGAVIPFSRARAYYWFGASEDPSTIPQGTNNLLQWKALISLQRTQVNIYDFGGARPSAEAGSKIEGIQKFKQRFGGEFVPTRLWYADLSLWKGPLLRWARKTLK